MRSSMGRGARRVGWLLALLACAAGDVALADTGQLAITAVVLSKGSCKFQTGAATLPFGAIDPTSSATKTASTTVQVRCNGGGSASTITYSLVAGNGLNSPGAGVRRVKHTTVATEFMAYSLSLSPASGSIPKNSTQDITISGTILPADFQNARSGSYSDTVVLDLYP